MPTLRAFQSVAAGIILLSTPVIADFEQGLAAYEKGDYVAAFQQFRADAERGDTNAQFYVGIMYRDFRGVQKNDKEAARWLRTAAEGGHEIAQYTLGNMYRFGESPVLKNGAEAVYWYRAAAEQGNIDAQSMLGEMYASGEGVPKDNAEAAHWYRAAAEQGKVFAQYNLGHMYRAGTGVPQDFVQAHKWWNLAASQGNLDARQHLTAVEELMTGQQIAEAQRLAAAFIPQKAGTARAQPPTPRPQATASATVRTIQRHLSTLGYDPGPADGLIGPKTTRAIQAFQRAVGIEPDGIASATLEALLSALVTERKYAPQDIPPAVSVALVSTGTGFFVSNSGHLLTNYHVIDDCTEIKVTLPGGSEDATLEGIHPDDDLAVLRVDIRPDTVAAFRRTAAELGEDVLVAGYPLHGLLSGINVTSGSLSSTTGPRGDRRFLQMTAPVQQGNSGGPLLDDSGAVVGVVVAKLNALAVARDTGDIPQNVNFAIKGAVARSFLSINDIPYTEVSGGQDIGSVAVAAQAQKHTFPVECWK